MWRARLRPDWGPGPAWLGPALGPVGAGSASPSSFFRAENEKKNNLLQKQTVRFRLTSWRETSSESDLFPAAPLALRASVSSPAPEPHLVTVARQPSWRRKFAIARLQEGASPIPTVGALPPFESHGRRVWLSLSCTSVLDAYSVMARPCIGCTSEPQLPCG